MARTLTSKPLDFFKPDPGNPRKSCNEEELRGLHDSLCKKQLVPLLVKPDGTIIDGWRRWCAAKLNGKPEKLDVIITDEPLTPAQIKEIQLVSALHRADLKPYEQYLGCKDWLALNPSATVRDLASQIDRHPSMLTRILSLSKCIPAVQAAAAEDKLGPSEWYTISQMPEDQQADMLAAKLAGATRDQLEQRGRKARNGDTPAIKVNRLKIPLGPQGRSVITAGNNLPLADVIEILQDTVKHARKAQVENLDGRTWVQVMQQKAKAGV
jgi:ParB family transcriptional regulator, chromosome partitioning protein